MATANSGSGEEIARQFDDSEQVRPFCCLEVKRPTEFEISQISCQSRLVRAARTQVYSGEAMFSRYLIWAETLRGGLMSVVEDLDRSPDENTRRNVVLVSNSLATFCEIQSRFRPDGG